MHLVHFTPVTARRWLLFLALTASTAAHAQPTSRTLTVLVTDRHDNPISGATVTLNPRSGEKSFKAISGADGLASFQITNEPHTARIQPSEPFLPVPELDIGPEQTKAHIRLTRGATLRTSYEPLENSGPCTAHLMRLRVSSGIYEAAEAASSRGDSNSNATFKLLAPGKYFVKWICGGRNPIAAATYPAPSNDLATSSLRIDEDDVETPPIELAAFRHGQLSIELPNSCQGALHLKPANLLDAIPEYQVPLNNGACTAELQVADGTYSITYQSNRPQTWLGDYQIAAGKITKIRTNPDAPASISAQITGTDSPLASRLQLSSGSGGGVQGTVAFSPNGKWSLNGLAPLTYHLRLASNNKEDQETTVVWQCTGRTLPASTITLAPGEQLYCSAKLTPRNGKLNLTVPAHLKDKSWTIVLVDSTWNYNLSSFEALTQQHLEWENLPEGRAFVCAFPSHTAIDSSDVIIWEKIQRFGSTHEVPNGKRITGELRSCSP